MDPLNLDHAAQRGGAVLSLRQLPIIVAGPTATGKSELAQRLAERLDGEVLSADSMQVYRHMDIGTGKLPASERRVLHHGLDIVDPDEPYSVALYQAYGRAVLQEIDARGHRAIIAGGTGFYLRSLIDDYVYPKGEQEGNPVRDRYHALHERIGDQALWEQLKAIDPASAELIHPHNARRVIRAFELLAEGASYAQQHAKLSSIPQLIPAIQIGLAVDPPLLNERIDRRVRSMMVKGLLEEVESLLAAGFHDALTAPQAIGYKELIAYLEGRQSLEEAVESIMTATHRYGKRQRSWFKRDQRIQWINADSGDMDSIERQALAIIATMDQIKS